LNTDFLVGIPVEVLLKTGTNRNRGVLSQFCTEKRLDENLVLYLLPLILALMLPATVYNTLLCPHFSGQNYDKGQGEIRGH